MKVEWLLEGKPLECANRIKEAFEFGHASLDITSVFPRDTGKQITFIACTLSNKFIIISSLSLLFSTAYCTG